MMRFLLPAFLALATCRAEPAPDNASVAARRPATEALPTGKLDRSHAGTRAPGTEFRDADGEILAIRDFSGRPVLLNLWATWCAPCVAEMPTLDALAGREGERLEVLTVSQDTAARERVRAWFDIQGFRNLEMRLDPEMRLMADLKVDTLPTTIFYDAEGREVWRVTGMEDWESAETAELLREAEAPSPAAAR
ncbi:MAG TPA: TlpA disulfide reductase family protein [Allosphingosinicella sp.]|nr:TlpA disulfide reductase family protein [Allosphingosinicella sp.]